jgi:predicted nucleic acid-binding protein
MTEKISKRIVVDTSVIIAVILNEATKPILVELTRDVRLIAPRSLPWEMGNAFSAMFKRKRLSVAEATTAFQIYQHLPILLVEVSFETALHLSAQLNIYAYDAYLLACALKYQAPLLSLDKKMVQSAKQLNIAVLEVTL